MIDRNPQHQPRPTPAGEAYEIRRLNKEKQEGREEMSNALAKKDNIVTIGPDQYIQQAIATGAGVETLERLMALKERHDATEAKKAYIKAMQQFQSMKPDMPKTAEVSFGAGKTAYKFCPLATMADRLKDSLTQCGLSYRFENLNRDGAFGVRCVVTHSAGHSEGTEMFAPSDSSGNKNQIQGIGSTSTYLMRYTLIAAFALTTADEDNDGQSHSDLPYQRLLAHNEVLRTNLEAVSSIKQSLAENDYYQVALVFDEMPDAVKNALWVAPTKGGIFTTEERKQLASPEFSNARCDYLAEKQSMEGVKV